MNNTVSASVSAVSAVSANTSIASAYSKLKAEGVNLKEVHGTDLQWCIVRSLPQMNEEETLQNLKALSSLEEGSDAFIELRNRITEGNLYYAYCIASKYAYKFGTSLTDDVYQNASLALIKAILDYLKKGNGETWLNYAKATICRYIQRWCITPHLKCGVKGGLNPQNKKHNEETNRKRAEKGLEPLETVKVEGAESTDDEGNKTNKLEALPSNGLSPLEELADKERYNATESKIAEVLSTFDTISQTIWKLKMEQRLQFDAIALQVGLKKNATQMRFYTVRDRINDAVKTIR